MVKGGRLDAARVDTPDDQAVPLRASQRTGEHLMGDTVETVVDVLVAPATIAELNKDVQRPAAGQQLDNLA